MPELTIAASGVRALLDLAVSKGANRALLLKRSVIDEAELADRDNRIPLPAYIALMRAAQEICSDPALALHFGEAVDVAEISIGCSVGGVTNLHDALAQVNRYARLAVEVETAGDGNRYQLKRCNGQLWIVDQRRNPNEFFQLTESSFARMICSTRRAFPAMRFFKEVHFTHVEPAYRSEYERIFQIPIVFGSEENAIRIDEAVVASARLRGSPEYVTSVLRDHAELLLQKMETGKSTRDRVETLLTEMITHKTGNMESVARKLGLSRQTLFRKLRAEGVTFQEILSELRCSLGLHYLNDRKMPVKETAYLLGFSDATAFSRAFKRWTGHPPGEARSSGH